MLIIRVIKKSNREVFGISPVLKNQEWLNIGW